MIASGNAGSYCFAAIVVVVDVDAGNSWTAEHVTIEESVAYTKAEESVSS